jgi:hypothetical protein
MDWLLSTAARTPSWHLGAEQQQWWFGSLIRVHQTARRAWTPCTSVFDLVLCLIREAARRTRNTQLERCLYTCLNYFVAVRPFSSAQSQILDKVQTSSVLFWVHQHVPALNIIITFSGYYPGAAAPSCYSVKTEPMDSSSSSYFCSLTISTGFGFSSTSWSSSLLNRHLLTDWFTNGKPEFDKIAFE